MRGKPCWARAVALGVLLGVWPDAALAGDEPGSTQPPATTLSSERFASLRSVLGNLRRDLTEWRDKGYRVREEATRQLAQPGLSAPSISALQNLIRRSNGVIEGNQSLVERADQIARNLETADGSAATERILAEQVRQLAADATRLREFIADDVPPALPEPTPPVTEAVAKVREAASSRSQPATPQRAESDERRKALASSLKDLADQLAAEAASATVPAVRQALLEKADTVRAQQLKVESAANDAGLNGIMRDLLKQLDVIESTRLTAPSTLAISAAEAGKKGAAAPGTETAPRPSGVRNVDLESGGALAYGLTVSLLRFSTSRRSNEPARLRNYTPSLELLPAEFGFQFVYHPPGRPWRLKGRGKHTFQLMSAGGIVLARVDNRQFERGGLSLAATLGFFEDAIGFGAGFDLYRGIPVQGVDGTDGGATAYTGLLAWGLARNGEVTPENVFALVSLNLAGLASRVTGEAE